LPVTCPAVWQRWSRLNRRPSKQSVLQQSPLLKKSQPIYQSTISPSEAITPDPKLTAIWGGYARQIAALLEMLKQDYEYRIDVPECGYQAGIQVLAFDGYANYH